MTDKKKFKDGGEGTKIGNFLRKIGKSDLLEKAVNVVGEVASGDYLGALKVLISKDPDITPEQLEQANHLIDLEFQDRDSARKMQIAALQQDDIFSKRFIYYYTIFISAAAISLIFMMFFIDIPDDNKRIVDMTIGILVGTGLVSIINYYFGSSQGSSNKAKQLNKMLNGK
ncbi:MAG: hypothetical protein DRQ35_07305 [Gammaproteobacteria bacterium]|nr:MAG: hypothetical protein DRQ35_07305 [Gammaproteobacteria bacterium]